MSWSAFFGFLSGFEIIVQKTKYVAGPLPADSFEFIQKTLKYSLHRDY